MELLERYLAAVARHAPINERVRIVKLVRALIDSKVEADQRVLPVEQKLTDVLIALGPPNQVVNQFLHAPRYLIGPAVYEAYWNIIMIVIWTIVMSLLVSAIVEAIFNGPVITIEFIFTYLTYSVTALAQAFFWITLVFIVFERKGVRIDLHTQWQPTHLPPVSKLGNEIPTLEPKLGLIFTSIAFVVFYFAPQIVGLYYFENASWKIISIFNLQTLPLFLPLFLIFFASSSAREIAKLMSGQWTYPVLFVTIVCNLITVLIVAIIVFEPNLWNPTFGQQFQQIFQKTAPFLVEWQILQRVVVSCLAIVAIADTIVSSIRVWKLHQAPPFWSNLTSIKKVGKNHEQKK
ncbi:MAG: hypothetical protein ACRC17_03635 [Culicoidibacterales bacterium]